MNANSLPVQVGSRSEPAVEFQLNVTEQDGFLSTSQLSYDNTIFPLCSLERARAVSQQLGHAHFGREQHSRAFSYPSHQANHKQDTKNREKLSR